MNKLFALFGVLLVILSSVSYAALKKDVELLVSLAPELKKQDLEKVSRFLPASLWVYVTDSNENIYVRIEKDGKVKAYDEIKKVDIMVSATEEVYREFLSVSPFDQEKFFDYIEESKIVLEPKSYRSKLVFIIIEDKFDVKLTKTTKNNLFVFLPAKFLGLFMR